MKKGSDTYKPTAVRVGSVSVDENNCFNSHSSGFGQSVNPVFDFVDTLGIDGQRTDDVFIGVYRSERDSGLCRSTPM